MKQAQEIASYIMQARDVAAAGHRVAAAWTPRAHRRVPTAAWPHRDRRVAAGAFFTRIVASAVKLPLEPGHIAELRKEEGAKLEEKMRRTREREAQMAEESDDEIVFSDEEDD